MPFVTFESQIRYLKDHGRVVSYSDAVICLLAEDAAITEQLFVLTFDDAYSDFYTKAMPVLNKYNMPATLFVTTGYIDDPGMVPVSRKGADSKKLSPMTWDQLRELSKEPLITIAAHTHRHSEMTLLTDEEILDDLLLSKSRFMDELGFVPHHFAYPRGAWNHRVVECIKPLFSSAAIVGGEVATKRNSKKYTIPRICVRRSDGVFWFKYRVHGYLWLEEKVAKYIKAINNNADLS